MPGVKTNMKRYSTLTEKEIEDQEKADDKFDYYMDIFMQYSVTSCWIIAIMMGCYILFIE